jgi:hypothetical protein
VLFYQASVSKLAFIILEAASVFMETGFFSSFLGAYYKAYIFEKYYLVLYISELTLWN